jgi:hypothetical protein
MEELVKEVIRLYTNERGKLRKLKCIITTENSSSEFLELVKSIYYENRESRFTLVSNHHDELKNKVNGLTVINSQIVDYLDNSYIRFICNTVRAANFYILDFRGSGLSNHEIYGKFIYLMSTAEVPRLNKRTREFFYVYKGKAINGAINKKDTLSAILITDNELEIEPVESIVTEYSEFKNDDGVFLLLFGLLIDRHLFSKYRKQIDRIALTSGMQPDNAPDGLGNGQEDSPNESVSTNNSGIDEIDNLLNDLGIS